MQRSAILSDEGISYFPPCCSSCSKVFLKILNHAFFTG
jgi:hypothetical protein